jgi:hypothetical protein
MQEKASSMSNSTAAILTEKQTRFSLHISLVDEMANNKASSRRIRLMAGEFLPNQVVSALSKSLRLLATGLPLLIFLFSSTSPRSCLSSSVKPHDAYFAAA